jgi:hypothetical protein
MSKARTALRLARDGNWREIAAIGGHNVRHGVRAGQLRLHRLSRGRLFGDVADDAALRRVPGQISMDQRRFLLDYARHDFSGAGEIVDLGCWLGSSTVPLAAGLTTNRGPAARSRSIYAYDLFRWESLMEVFLEGTPLAGRFRDGDDFEDAFRSYLAPWRDRVRVRAGDLTALGWADGPIEFLFVDAMKSVGLANNIARRFFGALEPGTSLVFHHDFAHYYTPWIPVLMHRLRDYLVPVRPVPRMAVLFRSVAPVPQDVLERELSLDDVDDAEVEAAFAFAAGCVAPEALPSLQASKLMLRVHQGDLERAVRERDEARRVGAAQSRHFAAAEGHLESLLAEGRLGLT